MIVCDRSFACNSALLLFAVLLLWGISGAVAPVQAATYCVGTGPQLVDAFNAARLNPGSNSIRIRPGQHVVPDGINFNNSFGGDLFISGDWNAGCTVRGENPYSTVIHGGGTEASAWRLRGGDIDIQLRLMSFSSVSSIVFTDDIFNCEYQGQSFVADRIVVGGTSQGGSQLAFNSDCHRSLLVNSVISGGAQGLELTTSVIADPPPVTLTHNTIIGSSGNSLIANYFGHGRGELYFYNNVFDRSGTQADVLLRNADAHAIGNHWSVSPVLADATLLPGSGNNVTGNPQLQTSGRPLEPSSPVINSGSPSIPGGLPTSDIEGGGRFVGSAPDRGAFETNVSEAFVLTVTNTFDSGSGSLREAITTANAMAGSQIITFNIPGACPRTISLSTPLPSLTDDGLLLINGQTQPGSTTNSLENGNDAAICLQISRSVVVGNVSHALRVPVGSNTFLILRGIGFGGFDNAIELNDGDGHLIQGNRFGWPQVANSVGVLVNAGSNEVKVGGTGSPAYRNTISSSGFAGVVINGGDNVEIGNNYIGTRADGLAAAANNVGIFVNNAEGTEIFSNLISGNSFNAVVLAGSSTSGTSITDNRIGAPRATTGFPPAALGNGGSGVAITGSAHDTIIGGSFRDSANIIAFNGEDGVTIESGVSNAVSGNRIYSNDGLGIDLAANGVTLNSAHPVPIPANYANLGRKFPVLSGAAGGDFSGSISGTLTATRGSYRVALFQNFECDASGYGEGTDSIGVATVLIPNLPGEQTVAFTALVQTAAGQLDGWISAIATDTSGNTSEFAACIPYVSSDVIFANGFD